MLKGKKGFTLIELMIVVAIIGILAAIAIPNFLKFQAKSKQSEAKTNLKGIYTAETGYFGENNTFNSFDKVNWSPVGTARYHYDVGAATNVPNPPSSGTLATAGGTDQALLFDSPDDDKFVNRPTYAYLEGPGFDNYAQGFDKISAYSREGGTDVALLWDSVGDDTLTGQGNLFDLDIPGMTQLQGEGFDEVRAFEDDAASRVLRGDFAEIF